MEVNTLLVKANNSSLDSNLTDCEEWIEGLEELNDYTRGFRTYSGIWCLFMLVFLISSLLWWRSRSSNMYLKRRNFFMVLMISGGVIGNLIAGPMPRFLPLVTQHRINCVISSFAFISVVPCFAGAQSIRMILFRNKLNFNRKVAGILKNRAKNDIWTEKQIHDLERAKYLASDAYGNRIAVGVLLFTFVCGMLLSYISCPFLYGNDCSSNAIGGFVTVIIASMCFMVFPVPVHIYLRRQARGEPDPFLVLREIGNSYQIAVPLGLASFVFSMFNIDLGTPESFSFGVFADFGVLVFFFYSVPYQVYKSYSVGISAHGSFKDFDLTLAEVLKSDIGATLFEQHLVNEFSAENLTFWKAANTWKKKYHSTDADIRGREAQNIYSRWLAPHSLLQVNMSGANLLNVKNLLLKEPYEIPETLFDGCQNEIFNLMANDSFTRFKNTPLFKEYLGTDDGKSGNIITTIWEDTSVVSESRHANESS